MRNLNRININNCKAVGFDLFWTLVEPKKKLVKQKLKEFCEKKWVSFKEIADIWKVLDNSLIEVFKILWIRLTKQDINELKKIEKLIEEEVNSVELKPYSIEILEVLREEEKKLFLISNLAKPYAEVIKRHRLEKYFDFMILSFKEGIAKPDPNIYKKALGKLRELGVSNPSQILFTGDRQEPDVDWPKQVGINWMLIQDLVVLLLNIK